MSSNTLVSRITFLKPMLTGSTSNWTQCRIPNQKKVYYPIANNRQL